MGRYVTVDTETNGLDPWSNRVLLMTVFDGLRTYVFDETSWPSLEGKALIAHNAQFDYKMLLADGVRYEDWRCTMLAEKILHSARPDVSYSLNAALERRLGDRIEDKADIRMSFTRMERGDRFEDWQIDYACEDVEKLWPLFWKLRYELRKRGMARTWLLENQALKPAAELEMYGLPLDWDDWNNVGRRLSKKQKQIERKISDFLWDNHYDICKEYVEERAGALSLFEGKEHMPRLPINLNSSSQKLDLFRRLGMDLRDKHGQERTDKDVMQKQQHPVADLQLQYTALSKHKSSFGPDWARPNPVTGRVHTSFNPIIATGRTSTSRPNVQQIPSDEAVRGCFKAPDGWDFHQCDYPSQEPRVTADKCRDRDLIRFFNEGLHGGDMHGFVAQKVHKVRIPPKIDGDEEALKAFYASPYKHLRQETKSVNLGLDYGLSAFSIAWDLGISVEEAEALISSILDEFPGKKKYFKWREFDLYKKGYIFTNSIVRRRYYPYDWEDHLRLRQKVRDRTADKEERSMFYRVHNSFRNKSLNFPTQSTAADMTKTAMILIRRRLIKDGYPPGKNCPVQLVNMVHDELLYCVRSDLSEYFGPVLKWGMDKAARIFLKRVEMVAYPQITKEWKK